ncbi:uncharacterized protein LOC128959045 [Oppia nitens]|uniref:uncharacterized protein LOC128959045 n=1 Tax=Oppia nitens TaxID=1686743 RepID=UPI0023DA5559|nr:uncharacterized protein LOC128959045 [Oppia nitens]
MIRPVIDKLSIDMAADVVFLRVDVDENEDIAINYNVTVMPTFMFIKNGQKVDEFSGINENLLKQIIAKHNNLLDVKFTKLSETISKNNQQLLQTINQCFATNQTQTITNTSNNNSKENNNLLDEKFTELSTNFNETMKESFTNQIKTITDAIITSNNTNKDNNDVITTTGKMMACFANKSKHIMNALSVRDKLLADILVESDTDSQWTGSQSIGQLVDDNQPTTDHLVNTEAVVVEDRANEIQELKDMVRQIQQRIKRLENMM